MQTIPADILARFDDSLKQRNIPLFSRQEYRKWLRYFLDFRAKYPLPYERSVQVKLFADKLRSKGQSNMQVEQAADAVSLFFASQQKQQNCPLSIHKEAHSHAVVRSAPATTRDQGCPSQPLPSEQAADMVSEPIGLPAPLEPVARRKGKYDDWRCLRESGHPAWDAIIALLADEIRTRHYSRKTLQHYANWTRNSKVICRIKIRHNSPHRT